GNAAGYGEAQNRVGNVNQGQARPGQARPGQARTAQENGVALDAEQLLFLAGRTDNAFDDDVDEQPVQDLALNMENVFQAKDCDAFDSDVDEAPTAQTMFIANLSSADRITDEAGPSYDLDILSEHAGITNPIIQNLSLSNQQSTMNIFQCKEPSHGYGEAQNRVGNVNQGQARLGQARTVKCYNCNGKGHIARNCTQPKRPQNSEYFKDKMLLIQAQENGVALDAEHLLFLAGRPDNAFDDDVDEQPVQDLALNVDNVFQAEYCDAFDSDVDEAPTALTYAEKHF
nr:retrovirus-related Pol polyprotein from transposon TNT 1-94 [Tanacetum cinerariifolium]